MRGRERHDLDAKAGLDRFLDFVSDRHAGLPRLKGRGGRNVPHLCLSFVHIADSGLGVDSQRNPIVKAISMACGINGWGTWIPSQCRMAPARH